MDPSVTLSVQCLRRLETSAEVLWEPQVFWISGSWFSYAVWWQGVFGSKFVGNECKVVRSSVQPNMKTKLTIQSDDLCYCWGGVRQPKPMLGQLCQFQVING